MRPAPCTVCGSERGTSLFYGGLVCCGCKVFFLRSVSSKARYRCSNNGHCRADCSDAANSTLWMKCRACRYQACLEAKMNPSAVGVVKGQRAARSTKRSSQQNKQTSANAPSSSSASASAPVDSSSFRCKTTAHTCVKSEPIDLDDPDRYVPQMGTPPLTPSTTDNSSVPSPTSPTSQSLRLCDVALPGFYASRSIDSSPTSYQPSSAVVPYFGALRDPVYLDASAIGLSFLPAASSFTKFELPTQLNRIVTQLLNLEKYCDGNESSTASSSSYINLDVNLGDALRNPLALCQRTSVDFATQKVLAPTLLSEFKALYCRYAQHYIDWIAGLPELQLLCHKDKMALITSQMCVSELVVLIYHTYVARSPGIVFPGGTHFIDNGKPPENDIDEFCQIVSRYVHKECLPEMKRLGITYEEFVLLKAIVFFNSTCILTDSGMQIVRSARQKYEQALVHLVAERFPQLDSREQELRVYRLVALNRHFMIIAMKDNIFLSRLCTLNIGNMRSNLLFDFYLKEY